MFTYQQKKQASRAIANKYGFTAATVTILDIKNVPKNIVIDGGSIEVEVIFKHTTGFGGSEVFSFNPSDMRKMPIMVNRKVDHSCKFYPVLVCYDNTDCNKCPNNQPGQ